MSRASQAGNSVMKMVEDLCLFHGVPATRMQSRMFTVPGVGGRERPFFVGEWTDSAGAKHRGGMADLLLQARITVKSTVRVRGEDAPYKLRFVTPVWVECKAGSGKQTPEQRLFQAWVEEIGATYLLVTESCSTLQDWFTKYEVRRD